MSSVTVLSVFRTLDVFDARCELASVLMGGLGAVSLTLSQPSRSVFLVELS